LYNESSIRCKGSLFNFKTLLKRNDITGKVKGAFKNHHEFFTLAGTALMLEMAMEYFGMANEQSVPTKNFCTTSNTDNDAELSATMMNAINGLLQHFKFCSFSLSDDIENLNGNSNDELFNYCCNVCHWTLHLLHIEDATKEGDLQRLLLNSKQNLLFFYSYSANSKYFTSTLDFIIKACFTLSPLMRLRILEGAFVNAKGGVGQNVEADLVQEHSVRNQKDCIRMLGANKTDVAMSRVTNAADAVASVVDTFDSGNDIATPSSRHGRIADNQDEKKIAAILREIRPFRLDVNRKVEGFHRVHQVPTNSIDKHLLKRSLCHQIDMLTRGRQPVLLDDFDVV